MAEKLTETAIKRAEVPSGKRQAFLWDGTVTGFGVRVLAAGSKTFWFQYRPEQGRRSEDGRVSSRMVRIGPWPSVTLDIARKRAKVLAGQVAHGRDPAAEQKAERMRSESTLRALLAEGGPYEHALERRNFVNIKPALSSLRRGLHRLMGKEVASLTRADIVSATAALQNAGKPGAATDLHRYTKGLVEWAVSTGRATHNVLAGLRQPKRTRSELLAAAAKRGRALSDDEICKLWQAAESFGTFGGLVRLALVTGLRRGELARLERARDILADHIVVQPEHAKTGEQHEVPLTPLMRIVIGAQPVTTSPLIFPSVVTGRRLEGWGGFVPKLRRASGVHFRLHDLRRTCRTLMSRLGVEEDIAELAIGHVRADLVARYNFDEAWDGRVDAFARVSDHVAALVGAREGAAVIPLRG